MEDASGVDVIFEAIDSVVFRPEVNFETVVLLGLVNELLCDVSRRFVALNAGKKYLANIRQVLVNGAQDAKCVTACSRTDREDVECGSILEGLCNLGGVKEVVEDAVAFSIAPRKISSCGNKCFILRGLKVAVECSFGLRGLI